MSDKNPADDAQQHPGKSHPRARWRNVLYTVIFRADERCGKMFDVGLMVAITFSVLAVMLESVPQIEARHGQFLRGTEWFFTIAFTLEYILRLISAKHWKTYALSFFGVVDLISILPTYLQFFIPGGQYLLVVRVLRLLRMFRVLKMGRHLREADIFINALRASRPKIMVFVFTILTLALVIGTLMYLIEGKEHGFTSIPQSVYWAIVTITTVGYGDISPVSWLGKLVASVSMLIGWSILAVPTGIVGVELARSSIFHARSRANTKERTANCPQCDASELSEQFKFCPYCGAPLTLREPSSENQTRIVDK